MDEISMGSKILMGKPDLVRAETLYSQLKL